LSVLSITTVSDRTAWNLMLRNLPCAHVLQTWEWGEFKQSTTGWTPMRFVYKSGDDVVAAASTLTRRVGPLSIVYVPKGPVLDYTNIKLRDAVLDHLQQFARQQRAIWLKIDPDVIAAAGVPGEPEDTPHATGKQVVDHLRERGWHFSQDQVQFRNTITLDLTQSEEDLLMSMSQNTRRKVRTATKKGVTVRTATQDDLPTLYDLYRLTGQRDNFLIRPPQYYEKAWRDFMQADLAHALLAEADGQALAHVILFHYGKKCWYFYGASSNEQREKMPNYLLQWEAIRWAKAQGYLVYDMWGAPDVFEETDSMWGVYQFKRGFRGTVTRHIGAWDYTPFPPLYRLYTQLWPRVLTYLRNRR
jgi:lipid II:glycine glycyltransferase (peptidoglycan interpeptide bridge formation enzyme)